MSTLAGEKKVNGRILRRAASLPQFKLLEQDGFKIRFEHRDPIHDGKNQIHLQFVRWRGEVYRIGMMARQRDTKTIQYEALAVDQIILRNAPGKLEGQIMQLNKPLPNAFGLNNFASQKCPTCKRHWKSSLKKLVFEKSNQPEGEPIREGPNVVYFFHHWRDDPKGEGLFTL